MTTTVLLDDESHIALIKVQTSFKEIGIKVSITELANRAIKLGYSKIEINKLIKQ